MFLGVPARGAPLSIGFVHYQHNKPAPKIAGYKHNVVVESCGPGLSRGGGPHLVELLHAGRRVLREILSRMLAQPHEMDVELVLRAEFFRADHEGDRGVITDSLARGRPRECPDAIRAPRILDACDGRARNREPVHKLSGAVTHLSVADRDVLTVFSPHFYRAPAWPVARAGVVARRPAATPAILRNVWTEALLDDVQQRIVVVGRSCRGDGQQTGQY